MIVENLACGPAATAEAKAYLRIDGAGEDALVGALVESAAALCEAFVGQMLVVRGVSETVTASGAWTRLRQSPVGEVTQVVEVREGGIAVALTPGTHAVDIDGNGDGWVRYGGAGNVVYGRAGLRLRVAYRAGLAAEWAAIPDALRQGIVRLAAHLYAHRDEAASPPVAVAALWRPYRRMRLR